MNVSGVHNNVDMADSLFQESPDVGQSSIDVSEGTGVQMALDDFRDFCALSDLQDLEAEGSISSGEYPHKLVTVSGMKKNSEFYPIHAKSQQLLMFHKLVQNDIEALGSKLGKNKSKYGNLTPGEYKALHALSRDDTIIIKKANKGGSVVVLDTPAYVAEVMRQLTDVETYTLLKRDPTEGFKSVLVDLLSEGFSNGVLTTREVEMLKCEYPVIPVFHVLPKVHKSLDNVKGRPIVASIGSLSENLSCYIDRLLRPLVESLPSYIRDTTMCINQIQDLKWKSSYRWFTMDVVSLYSSIDHSLGLQAIGYWLDKERIFPKAQSDFILQAVDFLLRSNYFLFDGKFYLQRCGAAMGASFAPTYANLFMGWFERLYIFGDQNPFRSRIFSFFRYIDDCIGVWDGDDDTFSHFVTYCNERVSGISFTYETNKDCISFLVNFSSQNGLIHCDLFRKPITRNTLLHSKSAHPASCLGGIPVGQFLRLRRICSTWDAFQRQAMALWDRFLERGYTPGVIKAAYERAVSSDRSTLLRPKRPDTQNVNGKEKSKTRFSMVYSKNAHLIRKSICKYWGILLQDPILAKILDKEPSFVYRKGRDMASWLSPSLYTSKKRTIPWLNYIGNYRCGRKRCKACHFLNVSKKFNSTHTGAEFQIKQYLNCLSKEVVYLITCSCGSQYVGKTVRNVSVRILEHVSAIESGDLRSAVSKHTIEKHAGKVSFTFQIIDKVSLQARKGDLEKRLLKREAFWIYNLHSLECQGGMNREWELSCFY
uniref:GIY-YIG domain-containing protein n=1 Tax=Xenopus tropicalis TaxID=8364 RepID=A0A803J6K6_XENTR